MKIIVFFLLFAFAEPLKLENVEFSKVADDLIQSFPRKISLKGIINELIKNFEGYKKTNVTLIKIDSKNSLKDIIIESNVSEIINDMDESLRIINIRNLTIPVSQFKLRGEYYFEELSLFDLLIYGQGGIRVDITELKIFLSLKAEYTTALGWEVKDIGIDASVKDSLIRLDNLMNGEPMGDFLNFMIDELFKVGIDLLNGLVRQFKTEIMEVLQKMLNSILD